MNERNQQSGQASQSGSANRQSQNQQEKFPASGTGKTAEKRPASGSTGNADKR